MEEVRPATATSSYSAFNVDVHMVTTCSSVHRNWAGTQWSSRTWRPAGYGRTGITKSFVFAGEPFGRGARSHVIGSVE